jgi:hypothetical protein
MAVADMVAADTWGAVVASAAAVVGSAAVVVASAVEEVRPILVALAWVAWGERVMVVSAAEQWQLHAALVE